MISKEMKRFLTKIPLWPKNVSFDIIREDKKNKDYTNLRLFFEGQVQGFININGKDKNSGIYLTEKGREAIDEYQRAKYDSAKSTWALIIAGLSFLSSTVAVVLSIFGVQ